MTAWHNLGQGSWWRPHINGVDAWHALAGYQGWTLRLCHDAADGPPFLDAIDLEDAPRLTDCRHLAHEWETYP